MKMAVLESPAGHLRVTATSTAVVRIELIEISAVGSEEVDLDRNHILNDAVRALLGYFAGTLREFMVPTLARGSTFQLAVWNAIRKIPCGQMRTYSEIADIVGNHRAARAVGAACRANPIRIIIPCHSVLGKSGSLTGYLGKRSAAAKKHLLELEGCNLPYCVS